MRRRTGFRPTAWDVLEERQVLANFGSYFGPAGLINAFKQIFNNPKIASSALTVGALGDSYTDEYKFHPPDRSHARNWVEILATKRNLSFGPFSTRPRPDSRNQGFAGNWAESAATSTDMVQFQLPGLVGQVRTGQVRIVSIFVGGNDFLALLREAQTGRIAPADFPAALSQVEGQAAANITTTVDTLLAANPNVKLVLTTLPGVGLTPIVQQGASTPQLQAALAATDLAIQQYDAAIVATAGHNPRIAVNDLAATTAVLLPGAASAGTFNYGGARISLTTPGDDYHDFFLADGLHPGTVAQGIIANSFINAIDTKFGFHVAPLSPTEIVNFARTVQLQTRHGRGPRY